MPIVEVNGQEIEFPDTMSGDEIKGVLRDKFPPQNPAEVKQPDISRGEAAFESAMQGGAFGFGDEVQAGIAAAYAKPVMEFQERFMGGAEAPSMKDLYGQGLELSRDKLTAAQEQYPIQSAATEAASSIATGAGVGAKVGGKALGKLISTKPLRTAAGLGGLSGGVYGYGIGEGGADERLKSAGIVGGTGALVAPAGAYIASKVAPQLSKGAAYIERKLGAKGQQLAPLGDIEDIAQAASSKSAEKATTLQSDQLAQNKIVAAIKKDYPDTYKEVIAKWQSGELSLPEIAGERVQRLAKGAAQYKSGEARSREFFASKILETPEKIKKSISDNISDVTHYFTNADDLLKAGRKKAKPYYDESYEKFVDLGEEIVDFKNNTVSFDLPKEVNTAIAKARRQYPSELDGLPDNSVKVLDYAKRTLDDDISTARRAGKKNLASSRKEVKNNLLNMIDEQVPSYKRAREVSGDYLSIDEAMDAGKNFNKLDPELLSKQIAGFTDQEKTAFKIGVGKQVRDAVDSTVEGRNPYNKIFGTKQQKDRLRAVLDNKEFINLEKNLIAEDRIFKIRNDVLGGSPTTSKAMAAMDIATGGADAFETLATGNPKAIGFNTIKGVIRNAFDGINDDTANSVAKILYETDPNKKLKLLGAVTNNKSLTKAQKKLVKQYYFTADDIIKAKGRVSGAVAAPSIINGDFE